MPRSCQNAVDTEQRAHMGRFPSVPPSSPSAGELQQLACGSSWAHLLRVAAPLCLLLPAGLAILLVRALLGFQFPVPWPDETGFIAQAFALAYHGTLFEPALNPDRTVMWMPPGYLVLLAGIYRVFGYGFALTRWVSALAMLAGVALAARVALRLTAGWHRYVALACVGVAFLSPYVLIDANIARMEAVFALLILLALNALLDGRTLAAASVVTAAGLVHFNAIYFVPAVVVDAAWRWASQRLARPSVADVLAAACVVAGWLLYGALIFANWPGFLADMKLQFTLKQFYGLDDPAHPVWIVLAAAGCALLAALPPRSPPALAVALTGLGFVVMAHFGHEIWYDFAQPVGFMLLAMACLGSGDWRPPWRAAAFLPALTMMAFTAVRMTPAMAVLRPHVAMLSRSIVAPAEIVKVRQFIAGLPPGQAVDFGWSGMEPFFFDDLRRSGARWQIIRHSVTEPFPLRASDWRVVCDSSEWPALVRQFDIDFPRVGRDTGCQIHAVRQLRTGSGSRG